MRVSCMKAMKLGSALAVVAAAVAAHADPVVTQMADGTPGSASALVSALLSSNSHLSVVAGSVVYTGAATASGTFSNGGTGAAGLGIDTGVVLTTGDARFIGSSAAFPGDSANRTGYFTSGVLNSLDSNMSAGNSLLDGMAAGAGTYNASILGFSFVPQGNTLQMQFVFGSEDYGNLFPGFPTDVMGIFVNGVNYALTSSGSAISASTINCEGGDCSLYRDNAPFSGTIDSELNGMTTVLGLSIPVMYGQTNTIAFGIADTFDDSQDSALMLRAGSISAVPEPSVATLLFAGLAAGAWATKRRPRTGDSTAALA
jgi:hypothetical protein